MKAYDVVIAGAGIVGLTLARELARRKAGRILVLEKENSVGQHASGRNSGVVHAGIYYPSDSLKARFCVEGSRLLLEYVEAHKLPVLKCGKVIVAGAPEAETGLQTLWDRAQANGVKVSKLDPAELKRVEPVARTHGWAIHSPNTAVIDSKAVLARLVEELKSTGVEFIYGQEVLRARPEGRILHTRDSQFEYGFFYNTAGVNADRISHQFGVGLNYRILPFKGLYWKATADFASKVRGLIYPVPDIRMPFLGVHITKTTQNDVLFGPTAIPAFGRENYSLFGGLDLAEAPSIGRHLLRLLIENPGGFRRYVGQELARYMPNRFLKEAQTLAEGLTKNDIGEFYKVGIRPQLMDVEKKTLEMDFVIKPALHSLHVLNAISPAFTSAMAFAPFLADRLNAMGASASAAKTY